MPKLIIEGALGGGGGTEEVCFLASLFFFFFTKLGIRARSAQ